MQVMKFVTTATCLAAIVGAPGNLQASQSARLWFDGNWNCTLDGRPTRMQWVTKTDRRMDNCRNDKATREKICTSASTVKTVGRFWDRSGPWKALALQSTSATMLSFRHPDGNTWSLQKIGNNIAKGWSTWRGTRYPLICKK